MDLMSLFQTKPGMSPDDIAKLLKTDVEALKKYEAAYASAALTDDTFDEPNSRQAADAMEPLAVNDMNGDQKMIMDRIVEELVSESSVFIYEGGRVKMSPAKGLPDRNSLVTVDELKAVFDISTTPQLGGGIQKRDTNMDAASMLLAMLDGFMDESKPRELRQHFYQTFRWGLDIQDLDPITYEILGCNKNSMSHWLPQMINPVDTQGFFRIPATRIMKVPMNMLQLTRCDYFGLTPATLNIVDRVCQKVFELDESKTYFIKTGTYSSKFDFRNAKVTTPKEVREIGEYLLYIHNQANMMASPLNVNVATKRPGGIYGVSTTNEWVVREYIPDLDMPVNPTIYKGLPLHTEYRVFVDFETCEVLGITPYWEPDTMKKRFAEGCDRSIHDLHDYTIYKAHEETLMRRYNENKDQIRLQIGELIRDHNVALNGQWSIDIMQNGKDFWLIDMALAENSAFYTKCVPVEKRRPVKENWIPNLKGVN